MFFSTDYSAIVVSIPSTEHVFTCVFDIVFDDPQMSYAAPPPRTKTSIGIPASGIGLCARRIKAKHTIPPRANQARPITVSTI
jgi:hypothetical protein